MKPRNIALVISPQDYDAFVSLIGSDVEFPADYATWIEDRTECDAMRRSLGEDIQEIEVHPDEFVDWLRTSLRERSLAGLQRFAYAKAASIVKH
jgi:hypothetical protein